MTNEEWTADTVGELSRYGYDKGIADAHNAAMAEFRAQVIREEQHLEIDAELAEGIAKRRRRATAWTPEIIATYGKFGEKLNIDVERLAKDINAALSAERENVAFWKRKAGEEFDVHRTLQQQRDEAIRLLERARYDAGDNDSMREEEALRAKIGGA